MRCSYLFGGVILLLTVGCGSTPAREVTLRGPTPEARPVAASNKTDPAELRTSLEQLLGHHATLSIRFMRAKVDQDPAFVETALQAVAGNTRDLGALIESVGDAEAAAEFEALWGEHIQLLFRYTDAVVEDDDQERQQVAALLEEFGEKYGVFMEELTGGALAADDVSAAMAQHADTLTAQVKAYSAGDYDEAFRLQRESYAHMFPTGAAIAAALGAPKHDPEAELRSALGMLLGEHVELAIDAMRAGVRGDPQFKAAAAALNSNTHDLTAAVETLFGARDAERFQELWGVHIDMFVDYTVALAEDDASRSELRRPLNDHLRQLGAFFSEVTDGNLPADVAIQQLGPHDDQLIEQIEAYADADYAAAYDIAYDAYQHMFANAAVLADGIQAQVSPQMPKGGAQTGGGGTAPHHGS